MQQPRYILIIIKTYLNSYYFFKQNKKNKNKILLKKIKTKTNGKFKYFNKNRKTNFKISKI